MKAKEVVMAHTSYLMKKIQEDGQLEITGTQEECESLRNARFLDEIKDRLKFQISNN